MTRSPDTPEPPDKGAGSAGTEGKGPLDDLISALNRAVARKQTNGTEDKENRT